MTKISTLFSNFRNENTNILIINYMMILYAISLLISYKISGTIFYLMLLTFFFNENFKERFVNALKNRVVQAFILYFLLHLVWMIGTENKDNGWYQVRNNILLLTPILFAATIKKEFIDKILLSIIAVLFLSSIYSFAMYFGYASSPFQICSHSIPFLYKSDYGFFLLIGIAYTIFKLHKNEDNIYIKILLLLFVILASLNIFIIGARIYMFVYPIAMITIFLLIYKHHLMKFLAFSLLSLVLATIIYTTNSTVNHQVNSILSGLQSSVSEQNYNSSSGARVGMILYSLPVIKQNFWFGVGTGDHIDEVVSEILQDPNLDKKERHFELLRALHIGHSSFLHNTYIQTLVQFGFVGFIIWINIFYQLIKSSKQTKINGMLIIFLVITYLLSCNAGGEWMFNNLGKFIVFLFSILAAYNFKKGNFNDR